MNNCQRLCQQRLFPRRLAMDKGFQGLSSHIGGGGEIFPQYPLKMGYPVPISLIFKGISYFK